MTGELWGKIQKDLKDAMRAKDEFHTSVLRMILASFERRATEKRTKEGDASLTSEDEVAILRSELKRRRESKDLFIKGGRSDLAEKEEKEIEVFFNYLPPELPREEIVRAVNEAIAITGASSVKDFGSVMKEALKTLKGRADGSAVSAVIKELLPS